MNLQKEQLPEKTAVPKTILGYKRSQWLLLLIVVAIQIFVGFYSIPLLIVIQVILSVSAGINLDTNDKPLLMLLPTVLWAFIGSICLIFFTGKFIYDGLCAIANFIDEL